MQLFSCAITQVTWKNHRLHLNKVQRGCFVSIHRAAVNFLDVLLLKNPAQRWGAQVTCHPSPSSSSPHFCMATYTLYLSHCFWLPSSFPPPGHTKHKPPHPRPPSPSAPASQQQSPPSPAGLAQGQGTEERVCRCRTLLGGGRRRTAGIQGGEAAAKYKNNGEKLHKVGSINVTTSMITFLLCLKMNLKSKLLILD